MWSIACYLTIARLQKTNMKILIVDDHIIFREGLASIIRAEPDIEIAGMAGSVREAVAMAGRTKPDVILMDFSLPDGTGADATRQILDGYADCKILFLTMSEEDDDLFAAIRSGAKGYLLKDMHPTKLVSAIRSVHKGESVLSGPMTLQLMKEISESKSSVVPQEELPTLTPRELDVVREIAKGKSNEDVGQELSLSVNTVKYYVHSILEKLELKNRREAVAYAKRHGLI